jgi:hypothetical protein
MTKPGERAQITFDDAAIYLRIVEPPEAKKEEIAAEALKEELPVFGGGRTPAPQVTLEAYNENDPFADTDLPVSLDDK